MGGDNWRERVHNQRLRDNPQEQRQEGETQKEYGARMAREARILVRKATARVLIPQQDPAENERRRAESKRREEEKQDIPW